MPGRKPKPTHLKILEGNPGRQKLPKGEPVPVSGLPDCPEFLDEYAKEEWHRLSTGLHALGIFFDVDVGVFAAYCDFYSQWRTARELLNDLSKKNGKAAGLMMKTTNDNVIQHTLLGIANVARMNMLRCAVEFGLTPSARARLAIEPGRKPKSKFEGLIDGGKK